MKKTKHGHTVERRPDGGFKITLDRRADSLGIGTANDPYLIAELMALDALHAEMRQADKIDEHLADEEVDAPPATASREERRIAELQRVATSEADFRYLLANEGLPEDVPFLGNADRARARRRLKERGAERHVMSDETPSAFDRAMSRIKSFGQTLAEIATGAIDRR